MILRFSIFQRRHSRGVSVPLIMAALFMVLIFLFVGMQTVNAMMDRYNVEQAAEKAVREGKNARQAKDIFLKSLFIESIYQFKDEDLRFVETPQGVQVQWRFEREVHVVGPAYLVYRFQGSAQ